jgi:lysozyme family protein
MANFLIAKNFTKDLEGGFWNDPSAGWTYAGITKKYYPAWPGFRRLLQLQQQVYKGGAIPRYKKFDDAELNKMVDDFYRTLHWGKYMKGDKINNQDISNFLYDFIVHKENDAIEVINKVAVQMEPGTYTEKTNLSSSIIAVINKYPRSFYLYIVAARLNYYANSKKFSGGLKAAFKQRVNKFPKVLTNVL